MALGRQGNGSGASRRRLASRSGSERRRGQGTIEYIIVLALGAVLALRLANFFNGVFNDGLAVLEDNVANEVASGKRFQ
jgi:hypothetical protein